MRCFRLLLLLFSLTLATALTACSDESTGDGDGGADTSRDTDNDGGVDSGDADGGGQLPPTGESLRIAFVTHTRGVNPGDPEEWKLWVTDEDCQEWPQNTCDAAEITGAFSCEVECRVAPDFDYLLWIDPDNTGELHIASLNGDLTVADDGRILAQGVQVWQLGPERVVFSRFGNEAGPEVFAADLAGGDEWRVTGLRSRQRPDVSGGFFYAPQIDRVLVNLPTSLSAMDLSEVGVTDPTNERLLYHFVSDVEQRTGSFYQGQMQIAVSDDGNLVAIVTDALDTTNPCDPGASTTTCDPEYTCSSDSNRCIGEQLVLHVINRQEAGLLSVPGNLNACTGDAECGQYHECDLSNPDATNAGVCIPGKRIVGAWRTPCQSAADGTPFMDPGEYSDLTSLSFRGDDAVLFVGTRAQECLGTNIPVTHLVAAPADLSALDVIVDNADQSHGGESCYDTVEEDYTPEGCNVEIVDAARSPSGQTVVFIASSVRSQTDTEVWLIDAWGRGGKDDLTRDILTEIESLGVFAP